MYIYIRKKGYLLALTVFLCIFMLGACGCMCSSQNDKNKNDYPLVILEYLNNKYPDDTFKVESEYGGSMGSQVHKFYVKSNNLNRDDISVIVSSKNKEDWKFSDNYIPLKYEKQTKEYLHQCYVDFFGDDVIVNYKIDIDDCADNVSFEEYLKRYLKSGVVMAHRNGHKLEPSLINETADFLKSRNCRCSARVYIVEDNVNLYNYTIDNYSTINKYYVDYYFCHNEDFSINNPDWDVKYGI